MQEAHTPSKPTMVTYPHKPSPLQSSDPFPSLGFLDEELRPHTLSRSFAISRNMHIPCPDESRFPLVSGISLFQELTQAFLSLQIHDPDGPKEASSLQRQAADGWSGLLRTTWRLKDPNCLGQSQTPFDPQFTRALLIRLFSVVNQAFLRLFTPCSPAVLFFHRLCRYVSSNLPVCILDHAGDNLLYILMMRELVPIYLPYGQDSVIDVIQEYQYH